MSSTPQRCLLTAEEVSDMDDSREAWSTNVSLAILVSYRRVQLSLRVQRYDTVYVYVVSERKISKHDEELLVQLGCAILVRWPITGLSGCSSGTCASISIWQREGIPAWFYILGGWSLT